MNETTRTTMTSEDLASSLSGSVKAFLAVTFGKLHLTRGKGTMEAPARMCPFKSKVGNPREVSSQGKFFIGKSC